MTRPAAGVLLAVLLAACSATPDATTSEPPALATPGPTAGQATDQPPAIATATSSTTTAPTAPEPTEPGPTPGTTHPSPTSTGEPGPADLSARPLIWFAPLPPTPGRTGSIDFMDQFLPDAPWSTAAGYTHVYSRLTGRRKSPPSG